MMYVCSAHIGVIDNENALNDLLDPLTESNDDLTTSSDHMIAKRLPIVFHIITFVIIQVYKYI